MKLFLIIITALTMLAGATIYVFYPVGEYAWMDSTYNKYKNVRSRLNYKALAIDPGMKKYGRAVSFPSPEAAIEQALYDCRKKAPDCTLYALGNDIVIGQSQMRITNLIEKYWKKHATRVFTSPWKGTALRAAEIKPALSGMTAYSITRNGLRLRTQWRKSGELVGEVLNNFSNPPRKDHGKWWIKGQLLCRQYENWYSRKQLCGQLALDGDQYLIYGETKNLLVIFKRVGD